MGALAFRTQLEAFPDLVAGRVHAIVEDERGLVWFCSDAGLFRFDGRDLFQYRAGTGEWEQLGRADTLYEDGAPPRTRGAWRFRRDDDAWQRFGRELPIQGAERVRHAGPFFVLRCPDQDSNLGPTP